MKTVKEKIAELSPERRAKVLTRVAELLQEAEQRVQEIKKMPDEDIDTSDIPELDDEFFKNAELRHPNPSVGSSFDAYIIEQAIEDISDED